MFCLNLVSFQAGIDRFQSRGQQFCKLLGIKESFNMWTEFNSHRFFCTRIWPPIHCLVHNMAALTSCENDLLGRCCNYRTYVIISIEKSQRSKISRLYHLTLGNLDCKTVGFFLKISKEIGNAWRKSLMRANRASLTFSASFHTFCLTARAYLNTQKYGLFCSL